jgi:hypothetical protein
MSKESKHDRPSLVGTRINNPRAQHHRENSFMRNARIVGFCFVGLLIGYIDRVAAQCVNTLTPKWSTKLGGFDVYVWDQCYSMEQTLRIE